MANSFRQLFQFSFTFLAIIFEKLPCVLSLFYAQLFMHFLFADFMQHFQQRGERGWQSFGQNKQSCVQRQREKNKQQSRKRKLAITSYTSSNNNWCNKNNNNRRIYNNNCRETIIVDRRFGPSASVEAVKTVHLRVVQKSFKRFR